MLSLAEAASDPELMPLTVVRAFASVCDCDCELDLGPALELGSSEARAPSSETSSEPRPAIRLALCCRGQLVGMARLTRARAGSAFSKADRQLAACLGEHAGLALGNALALADERKAHTEEAQAAVEQLHAERAADAKFRALLESAPDAMVIVDESGSIVLVNGQVESLFGYSREELMGQPIERLMPARFQGGHVGHRTRYFREQSTRPMGAELALYGQRKDGSEFPIEVSLSPLQTESGLLVSSAIRDITDRHRADQQRARLAALVESSDDAIIGKTLTGVVTSWNRGAEQLFGYESSEIIGRSIAQIVPQERASELVSIIEEVARGTVLHFDTVRRRKDGANVHVSLTVSPVRDAAGRVIGISKVARDVTARRAAEHALALAKDKAEAAIQELEAFSYSVAHDLRAPLRGMNGFAQLLLAEYASLFDEQGKDWLHEILVNAERMGALIDALLSLSRLSRSQLQPTLVDLSQMVRTVVEEVSSRDRERTAEFRFKTACAPNSTRSWPARCSRTWSAMPGSSRCTHHMRASNSDEARQRVSRPFTCATMAQASIWHTRASYSRHSNACIPT